MSEMVNYKAVNTLDKGTLDPDKMITGVLNLKDAQQGFELLDKEQGKNIKILLKVQDKMKI